MLFVEIQRGKKGMETQRYNNSMMKTAACTARLIKGTRSEESEGDVEEEDQQKNKDTYYADAWFGSVDAALAAMERQSQLVCVIKTNSSRYPKQFIESKMQDWPAGSHLLLESRIEFKKLYALGYKYCKKKTICFLFTEGAGHTEEGDPYVARWKDEHGNTVRKFVKRPDVIANYFHHSNRVDTHNHARQGELQLEKAWITTDGFFRIATTLFGLTITDAWLAYKHHLHPRHRHKRITIVDFASLLAKDLLENKMNRTIPCPDTMSTSILCNPADYAKAGPRTGSVVKVNKTRPSEVPEQEKLTQDSYFDEIDLYESEEDAPGEMRAGEKEQMEITASMHEMHTIVLSNEWTSENKTRTYSDGKKKACPSKRRKRGKCLYCNDRNTAYYCAACPPGPRSRKHWVCGPPVPLDLGNVSKQAKCQRAHREAWMHRIQTEEDDMTVE